MYTQRDVTTVKNIGHEFERKWGGTWEELKSGKGEEEMMCLYFNFSKRFKKNRFQTNAAIIKKLTEEVAWQWGGVSDYTLPQKEVAGLLLLYTL